MPIKKSKIANSGFTLVELVITITILGILTTAGFLVFTSTSKSSKDEIRFRDLTTYKQSLSLYYQANKYYPSSKNDLVSKYLDAAITDPTGQDYIYQASPGGCTTALKNCTSYVICSRKDGTKAYDIPTSCRTLSCSSNQNNCMGVTSDD